MKLPERPLAVLAVSLLVASATGAQMSEAKARADIAFARGLAQRYQYVDLAEAVLADVERAGVSRDLKQELGVVKCGVYAESAKREGDAETRGTLYGKAIDAYLEFIEANPHSDFRPQAEREYVDIVNAFGQVLERNLEDALGEEATVLRGEINAKLEGALQLTGNLIAGLQAQWDEEPDFATKAELAKLLFNRGQMLFTLAKVADEGAFYYGQAEQTLEDLALFIGEQTPGGLAAYLILSQVKAQQGQYADAVAFAEFVVDTAVPSSNEAREDMGWSDATKEQLAVRWKIAEKGIGTLTDANLSAGDTDQATRWALHYYNSWKRDGFELSKPWGYMGLLACARTLLDAGGQVGGSLSGGNLAWFETEEAMDAAGVTGRRNKRSALDLALLLAQEVNEENKGNTLQIRAQKLISDVIDRPGVVVSPDVLFEAAQGEYFAKNYEVALEAFRGVLRALDAQDEATRKEYGGKVLFHVGDCLRRLDRTLEGSMAFEEGFKTYRGDPEYDVKNAQGWYKMIGDYRRQASDDPALKSVWMEAENAVVQAGSEDTSEIVFRQAERKYGAKEYADARAEYLKVEQQGGMYEKALVKAALCLYKQKDLSGAEKEFLAYTQSFVTDPKNVVTSSKKKAVRAEARAMAGFYLGRIAFEHANKSGSGFDVVVERLERYHVEFPDQDSYGPNALYMVLLSHLSGKDFDAAKSAHDQMVEHFRENKWTGTGALKIYGVLKSEQEAAKAAKDDARYATLTRKMAEYLRLSSELDSTPSFTNLRNESALWVELEEWDEGERVLRAILRKFDGVAEHASKFEKYVRPDLGLCLLRKKDVQGAFEVLDTLVPDPEDETDTRKPSKSVVRNWALSVTGWIEGDARSIVEVPGVGGKENLEKADKRWRQLESFASKEKWECSWYEVKFNLAYCHYQLGGHDSQKTDWAKSQIETLRNELGPEMEGIEERCGDETLRRRFLWLWGKVN